MNTEEIRSGLENHRDCSLKIVSDNVVSLCSTEEILEVELPQLVEQESRCQNGVCTLSWKPRRAA